MLIIIHGVITGELFIPVDAIKWHGTSSLICKIHFGIMGLFKISYMPTLLDYLRDTWIDDEPPATVEWEVAGLIPVNRPTFRVLK